MRDWNASMAAYVLPELGRIDVDAVAAADVKRVLRSLALAGEHATARMIAERIAAVLEWAEVESLREPAGSGRAAAETVMRSLPKAAARHHWRRCAGLSCDGLAFRGPGGGELGKSTVPKALGKAEIGATAHGFRSSFKDWARHEGVDELLSEFALAHVEAKTVAAYGRDSLVEKRRPVMQAWCDHVTGAPGN